MRQVCRSGAAAAALEASKVQWKDIFLNTTLGRGAVLPKLLLHFHHVTILFFCLPPQKTVTPPLEDILPPAMDFRFPLGKPLSVSD